MAYTSHHRQTTTTTYASINPKDFTNIDLAPLSPTKSSNSTEYGKFRNDRVLSVQDKRNRGQNAQASSTRVRQSIFGLRRALLVVRALQLVGAAGLLACLCLLGNIPEIQSYIVRAPVSSGRTSGMSTVADDCLRLAPTLRVQPMLSSTSRAHQNIEHLLRPQHTTFSRSSLMLDLFHSTSLRQS